MDQEQTKQLAAAARTNASMQEKELKFQVLQVSIASVEKLMGGSLNSAEDTSEAVIKIANKYMEFLK